MTVQAVTTDVHHLSATAVTSSSSLPSSKLASAVPPKDLYNMYQSMYNSPQRPSGFFRILRSKVETLFIYMWVLVQTLFLIAGLTVLHFSTFSVMVVYLVNGVIRGRRELLPHKHVQSN
ncbi:unnamed protein product [Candidula unifasciata]|uniref:Uncharacterized protein n=1 Tax=Candidula unifasciata TaxID=100452 RepID=A0A8S3YYI2_9EUPU|nr:unnamed protein product [Candidula unifasciata]